VNTTTRSLVQFLPSGRQIASRNVISAVSRESGRCL
jgi:hypothetical protein